MDNNYSRPTKVDELDESQAHGRHGLKAVPQAVRRGLSKLHLQREGRGSSYESYQLIAGPEYIHSTENLRPSDPDASRAVDATNRQGDNVVICIMNHEIPEGPASPLEGMPFTSETRKILYPSRGSSSRKEDTKDDSDSDYQDQPKKRKINKNGEPRKVRKPRAFLRQWNENDVTRALMGIVWAAGENNIRLPFDQAAQVVGEGCTASALQQAILKIHTRINEEGAQIPKIKMSWPSKASNTSDSNTNGAGSDSNSIGRPHRSATSPKSNQTLMVTLKGAYKPAALHSSGPSSADDMPTYTEVGHPAINSDLAFATSVATSSAHNQEASVPSTPGPVGMLLANGMITPDTSSMPPAYLGNMAAPPPPMMLSGLANGLATPPSTNARRPLTINTGVTHPGSSDMVMTTPTPTHTGFGDNNGHDYLMEGVSGDIPGTPASGAGFGDNLFDTMLYNEWVSQNGIQREMHGNTQNYMPNDFLGNNDVNAPGILLPGDQAFPSVHAQNYFMGMYPSAFNMGTGHDHPFELGPSMFPNQVRDNHHQPLMGVYNGFQGLIPNTSFTQQHQPIKEEVDDDDHEGNNNIIPSTEFDNSALSGRRGPF
ncbi:unnamed protein product [Periconia digitata]|uniref:Uncharacterized protein n=1 Tax=Periconia digitata TaxID=1303443 RepID=A0A9W4XIZ0_9PLEO|nr:unnamed protein product [Periconia digitata]